jgi:hypothetical protein
MRQHSNLAKDTAEKAGHPYRVCIVDRPGRRPRRKPFATRRQHHGIVDCGHGAIFGAPESVVNDPTAT